MDAKLTKALSALADKLDHGHLLLSTDAVAFVDAVIAHLEAAEAEVAKWKELHADRDHDLKHEYTRANEAETEVERLRTELEVTRDILRGVEAAQHGWYQDVMDYLETLE